MKNIIAVLFTACLFTACSSVIKKNKNVINELVSTRQVSKSIKVTSYNITGHRETNDSLIVYVKGEGKGGSTFSDTLRLAKNPDGRVAIKY